MVDLSGISNDPSCELEPELTRSVNVDGAKRLAVAAREQGVRRYVFSSSCSVYGHGEGLGLTETSARHPVSLYARAKAEVEDFLLELGKSSRGEMDVTCLRLATVFGLSPRMRFDLAINVMTKNAYVAAAHHGRRRRAAVAAVRARARRRARLRARADERRGEGRRRGVQRRLRREQRADPEPRVPGPRRRARDRGRARARPIPICATTTCRSTRSTASSAFRAEKSIDDGIREVLGALREGVVDPEERR